MDMRNNGQHDMALGSWTNVTATADYGLFPLFHSSNFGSGGNRHFLYDPEIDRLLDLGRQELDPAASNEIYTQAQHLVRDSAQAIYIWQGEDLVCISSNISGFINFPNRSPFLYTVYFTN